MIMCSTNPRIIVAHIIDTYTNDTYVIKFQQGLKRLLSNIDQIKSIVSFNMNMIFIRFFMTLVTIYLLIEIHYT